MDLTATQKADMAEAGRSCITGRKWSTLAECQAVDDKIRDVVERGGLCGCWLNGLLPRKNKEIMKEKRVTHSAYKGE